MSRVLVTGASGFVGRRLCEYLIAKGHQVVGTVRSQDSATPFPASSLHTVGDIGDDPDWSSALRDVDCVVHLAARVHVMREVDRDPLKAFRSVNVSGTEKLLQSVGKSGASRFIYLSTIKIHGNATKDAPFSISDSPMPADPYAQSKLEAELLARKIGSEMGFETVVIRPPLVYGPGVQGNFVRLLSLVEKGVPLPFGLVNNSRSLVSLENLCGLIGECVENSSAPGRTFLVSDNDDLSTAELVRLIASAMRRPARLLPVPVPALRMAGKMLGQSAAMSRLIESLQVDIQETIRVLNWQPSTSVIDGIQSTAAWYEERYTVG